MAESTLQTVDRALVILELLAREQLTATDIQKKLNLNKSTVHRLMMTLLNRGFVERNTVSGYYQIGLKMIEISSIRLNQIELKTEASPYLYQLAEKVNHSVQLAIYDQEEAVFIEKIEKYRSMHMYCQIGSRTPLYASAVGKILLSEYTDQEVKDILGQHIFQKFTENTHTKVEGVLEEIRLSRKTKYAVDRAEHEMGVYCMAMPVYDYRSKIIAAVSISGLKESIYKENGEKNRTALAYTCQEISKRMGYVLP